MNNNPWLALLFVCLFAASCSSNKPQSVSATQADPNRYNTTEAKQQACDRGELDMCLQIGKAHVLGEGVPKDKARGVQYLKKGCDGNLAAACTRLGVTQLMHGPVTPEDLVMGIASVKKGCDNKDGEACAFLGTVSMGLIRIEGVPRDEQRPLQRHSSRGVGHPQVVPTGRRTFALEHKQSDAGKKKCCGDCQRVPMRKESHAEVSSDRLP